MVISALAGLMAGCSALQKVIEKPTVRVQEVTFHAVSLREGRLDSRMLIHNPNGFSLPINKLSYSLKLNGSEFVNSTLSFDRSIPANGAVELQVPIHFQYGNLLQGLSSILQQRTINFQLAGRLDLGLIEVPFSRSGEFALKR